MPHGWIDLPLTRQEAFALWDALDRLSAGSQLALENIPTENKEPLRWVHDRLATRTIGQVEEERLAVKAERKQLRAARRRERQATEA